MKKFLITVDTEGDNLWSWSPGNEITTENTLYIPRFQELCEKYGFKPVYLTNYEMAKDPRWVAYASRKSQEGKCEIGMHLHAWNTPPEYELENRFGGNPYITEYPANIMEAKVSTMMQLLQDQFACDIVSHRSGRWATNPEYFNILARYGIRVDCSITPELDLSAISGCSVKYGNDYRRTPKEPYFIHPQILEIPMTTRRVRHFREGSLKHRIKTLLQGDEMWLRPIRKSVEPMLQLTQRVEQEKETDYLEFMIHSSELMPGGSVYFKNNEDVELLYQVMEEYFRYLHDCNYIGMSLREMAAQCGGQET